MLQKYRLPLVNYLNRMIQNQSIAEELSEEVFLRVYRARGAYEPLLSIAGVSALSSLGSGEPRESKTRAAIAMSTKPVERGDLFCIAFFQHTQVCY